MFLRAPSLFSQSVSIRHWGKRERERQRSRGRQRVGKHGEAVEVFSFLSSKFFFTHSIHFRHSGRQRGTHPSVRQAPADRLIELANLASPPPRKPHLLARGAKRQYLPVCPKRCGGSIDLRAVVARGPPLSHLATLRRPIGAPRGPNGAHRLFGPPDRPST